MRDLHYILLTVILIEVLSPLATIAHGDAVVTGDAGPPDPITWTEFNMPVIGGFEDGSLTIDNDSDVVCFNSSLGLLAGSVGRASVSGPGSTWTNTQGVCVGCSGGGIVNITSGGALISGFDDYIGYASDSSGSVTISGSGSRWYSDGNLYAGFSGSGDISVTDGGTLENEVNSYLGYNSDSIGTVTASGGSTWLTNILYVGYKGHGVMNLTSGASVESRQAYIGGEYPFNGVARVSGEGSTWTLDMLRFGWFGSGTMEITDGGAVYSTFGDVNDGIRPSSVMVSGPGSTWAVKKQLDVSNYRKGSFNILDGGLVSVGGELRLSSRSSVTMGSGGMFALAGQADDSLEDFLQLIGNRNNILYWEDSVWDWTHISEATRGEDYSLEYLTEGDLAGYTVLTVHAAPEPGTLILAGIGGLVVLRRPGRGGSKPARPPRR